MDVIESDLKKLLGKHDACQVMIFRGSFLGHLLLRCKEARLSQICETKNRVAEG